MNVLLTDRGKVVFAHQSYLDHLTADRVLREVRAGSGTVLGWLEGNDQSLFRRGQLRQLLTLLRDDDPTRYEESLRALLTTDGIRFHLKHLALQMLGQADPPTPGEIDLAVDLLRDEQWIDHVSDLVFTGRVAWADALHARGILAAWLDATDERLVNRALYLLSQVSESRGEMIEPLLLDKHRDKRREKLERVLWLSAPERLPPRLFKAFVRMTQRGSPALMHSIRWKTLAAASPSRCIEVLDASLRSEARGTYAAMADESIRRQESRGLRREDVDQVAAAAAKIPIEAWDKLVPLLVRILRGMAASRRTRGAVGFSSSRYLTERQLRRITLVLMRVLRAAGSVMASTDTAAFWDRVGQLSRVRSAAVSRLLVRCIASGPDDQADASLRWLLTAPARLRCGSERGGVYGPAYRLLRRYSHLCSDELFSQVLPAVLDHRPQAEKNAFLRRHELLLESLKAPSARPVADVLTYNTVGLGQYVLLSALPAGRLTGEAKRRFSVLRRKFGPVGRLLKGSPRSTGGRVTSTIPRERLPRLSNRDWLAIISRQWRDRPRRWREMGPGLVGEATVESFAADLGSMTKLQPLRFARLALAIPESSEPRYARAILQNLTDAQPPSDHKNPEQWQAASVEDIEALVDHFERIKDDREFAAALCWAIVSRSAELWSERTYRWLARIAMTHPHPRDGEYAVYSGSQPARPDGPGEPDILATSINCVRGVAAEAIQATLFTRADTREIFRPAIAALAHDPHPAVRVAAIGLALPLFNIDRPAAVTTFLVACSHERDDVLRSRYVNEFLRYAIWGHVDEFGPFIERMVHSPIDEVAESGAGWVAAIWAHHGIWEDRLETCLKGLARPRKGVARALALAVANEFSNRNATERLCALLDDPDKDVRAAAASFFGSDGAFESEVTPSLAQRFAVSAALDANMDDFLSGLEHYPGELKQYAGAVFAMAERLSGPLAAEARDYQGRRPFDAELLTKVLLRLYEQAEHDRELRRRCLDAWDGLISQRIGLDALRHIDA